VAREARRARLLFDARIVRTLVARPFRANAMPYKDTLAEVDFNLQRESAFSYQCNACSRCCHNKAIRVGA
jgi:hypothetical protein